ncbi:MAG: CRTAC1 family protein [Planctomycetota bacterium]
MSLSNSLLHRLLNGMIIPAMLLHAGCQTEDQTVSAPIETTPRNPESSSEAISSIRPETVSRPPSTPFTIPKFRESHSSLLLEHIYVNGASGEELMVESTGGGVAWLDFDRDDFVDLYLNQGGSPKIGLLTTNPLDQLFRNRTGGSFQNVTEQALIHEQGYSQGVAAGDFDNDGFMDVYVTNVGANSLFRNLGDGTFQEISAEAGVDDPRWSSSAAWADLDTDGDLDLYVCNYLKFDPDHPVVCRHENGQPGMCDPHQVEPWPDEFFLNLGDGTFRSCARELGLFGEGNKALGVAIADLNGDHRQDIYVCNDTTDNFLFLQQESFHFSEQAQSKGCAVSGYGEAQASMGIAVSDYNRDGLPDLYLTHFTRESNTLYQNLGDAGFNDVTSLTGLHKPTLHHLGFGVLMADLNFDGYEDIFVANGHIDDWSPHNEDYEQTLQMFCFDGRRWHETGTAAGGIFSEKFVARGVASADLDNDGDLDIACVCHNKPALILLNETQNSSWLRFRLIGKSSNRHGVGCRIEITDSDSTVHIQQLCGGSSYCSSHEAVMTFGALKGPVTASIRWPNGTTQLMPDINPGQLITVSEP